MRKYWDKAVSYETYKQEGEARIVNPRNEDDREKREYYELGLSRMARVEKLYKTSEENLATLKAKNFDGKILIISEVWCGDASAAIPALEKFFLGINEVKIFNRDDDPTLINQFLTDGGQSIPKVLILNEDYSVRNLWGPRPEFGTALLKKFKENENIYSREEFYNDLQVYYAKNRGEDIVKEILNLL